MNSLVVRITLVSTVVLAVAAAPVSTQKGRKAPRAQLIITSATVLTDPVLEKNFLVITGFNFASEAPLVTLGLVPVAVVSAGATGITADVTGVAPGSHLLTVSRGPSTTDVGVFEVMIGAVDPPGPTGNDGEDGAGYTLLSDGEEP
ncbi:MAG: hypothetical protein QF681_05090 [Vicinamibacterales bacterium]|jgi:hypothetical protein|nr:hypothetical protein [Vicinamibacterales bacterium]